MKNSRAREGQARAQRAVREKTEVAFAEERGHVGAVLLRDFVGVAEGEEILNGRAVEERRAAPLAVERGGKCGREAAGPRRLRRDVRRGLAREHRDAVEKLAQLVGRDGGSEPLVAEPRRPGESARPEERP